MRTIRNLLPHLIVALICRSTTAQLPPPPAAWADWSMSETPDDPGALSAESSLDQPAAKRGPVVIRDGHFFTGDHRLRLWGVNIAFGANFPTHEEADRLARRFSRFGINAVRFHHMDNQPFPNGIFADAALEKLSPDALDRLDYFIAALKAKGVYADLNLHVSRNYNHYHKTAEGHDGPRIDKMVDLFDPELIAAQKKYASDLLTHVNAYTHNTYATEPAVAIVEINNENSVFMWGADRSLAQLPDPYSIELKALWNQWLATKYSTREKLKTAWNVGFKPAGPNLLRDPQFEAIGKDWRVETHDSAKMTASADPDHHSVKLRITQVDGTAWHLQFNQSKLTIEKGGQYTDSFTVRADHPTIITVGVSQAHDPWQAIGSSHAITAGPQWKTYDFGFISTIKDDTARLTFMVGQTTGTIWIADVKLHTGGGEGIADAEDPNRGTVQVPDQSGFDVPARSNDWYDFLQQTEEKYYVGMMNFLKNDIGVKYPITGTIGFGPMGTYTQSKMDFVDAHAYWEHPDFPHRQWDLSDWTMANKPMVDDPAHATLWGLAATRVAGKPFTVTEYQHPAPNDWEAECIPFIASYAASQDWDGIFLFAYSHDSNYQKQKISSFFDIEGNPTKMPLVPMGARLFLSPTGKPGPPDAVVISHRQALLASPKYSFDQAGFLRDIVGVGWERMLANPIVLEFGPSFAGNLLSNPCNWSAAGPGTGRFEYHSSDCDVFVGFTHSSKPIELGGKGLRIESLVTPFATIIAQSTSMKTFDQSDELMITAVARARNTDMQWDADRHSIGNHWGQPPVQIEVVTGVISLPGRWSHAYALDSSGKSTGIDVAERSGDRTILKLGSIPALAYQVVR